MTDTLGILIWAFIYAAILFLVAWRSGLVRLPSGWLRPAIYSLSLGVYCSSWTFFGAVGRAVEDGWSFVTIYLGPICVFVFAWPFIRRLSVMSRRNRVTSIADFIGSRYGKRQLLAAAVTFVAVIGTLPYIALQLKAISLAWAHLEQSSSGQLQVDPAISLVVAVVMAVFTALFGSRVSDDPHRHQGLITAISLESVVKLLAFAAVAWCALGLIGERGVQPAPEAALYQWPDINPAFLTQLLLAAAAIVCLPRQFHIMLVEHHNARDLRIARWAFPAYLALFCVLILPVVGVGQALLGDSIPADMYVLGLPLSAGSDSIAAVAFLGGLSAATGMVVVAAITLAVMISNELVMPLIMRLRPQQVVDMRFLMLTRRVAITAVILMGWLIERLLSASGGLASIGLIAFAAAAQLLPAIVAALYWQRGHGNGVLAGLGVGVALWFYCLLLPAVSAPDAALLAEGLWGVGWLSPVNLLGLGFLDPLTHGVLWSIGMNLLVFVLVSRRSRFSAIDVRQANAFTQLRQRFEVGKTEFEPTAVEARQLQALLFPLMGEERSRALWRNFEARVGRRLLPNDNVPRFVFKEVENNLAAIVGAVSAHRAMELVRKRQPLRLEDFVSMVGDTSRQIQFGRELLQITLETIPQGISVVDAELRLVAWNDRYRELFDFPERLLYVGCPIEKVYRFNADRGFFGERVTDIDAEVNKRLDLLRQGNVYRIERHLATGPVLEIRGTPMPNGGYVTTYTDVTDYHTVQSQLEEAKKTLESRVEERTAELAEANASLQEENRLRARVEEELQSVYQSKSRFLAATSHDLLQPINAARLFVSSLQQRLDANSDLTPDVASIDQSLENTERLITSLREISRLDSGKYEIKREHFPVADLLQPLINEFSAAASHKGLAFSAVPSGAWLYSDRHLLRRVVQNFLSNALAYTRRGKVLVGCRRRGDELLIEVHDTGPGIAEKDRQRIFGEFERAGDIAHGAEGLGLGLSIANRIAQVLGHRLSMDSRLGVGTVFRVHVPIGVASEQAVRPSPGVESELKGYRILCVDNDSAILAGMKSLLEQWGCEVVTALDLDEARQRWQLPQAPDLVLADYHLDQEATGVQLLQALSADWKQSLAAVVISADNSPEVRGEVAKGGYRFLAKPVKPAGLRSLLRQLLQGSRSPSSISS